MSLDMYEPVIGLEIHLHLKTLSKMFCGCRTDYFGQPADTHTCPVCLGLPGVLPVINAKAVGFGLMFGLALNCRIAKVTQFHRKNYFYPDNPKNYQISQYDQPLAEDGWLELDEHRISIKRVHLEEDAGKSVHPAHGAYSLIDLNRAGSPLLEMVTGPDIKSPDEARRFMSLIRSIAQTLGISDANPEEGKMRADVNLSLHKPSGPLGIKVEIKNLNSFRSVKRALEYEIKRQTALLEAGATIEQATLAFDESSGKTRPLRSKEAEADYRYFPDPDLGPLKIGQDWLDRVREAMPELPASKQQRYLRLGIKSYDADLLAGSPAFSTLLDQTLREAPGASPQKVANWINADLSGYLGERGLSLEETRLQPRLLGALVELVEGGQITGRVAKALLPEVMQGADPRALVRARSLEAITDKVALRAVCHEVLDRNPKVVAEILDGKLQAINALLGQVMKVTRGTAKPALVRTLLHDALGLTKE